ncbi:hypothetical protein PM082_011423 [Marasmius tenuissimus]|nr:hypothetical protein PM082_011423 [Marasmius tenuissimus]
MQFPYLLILAATGAFASPTSAQIGPEVVSCYNGGTRGNRLAFVTAIDEWCAIINGTNLVNGQEVSTMIAKDGVEYYLFVKAINGCNYTIDCNCNRLLRRPVDSCNINDDNGKQGGVLTDSCVEWRADPGRNGQVY